ncbi:MAG: glycoside hydrolase family 13 protein [Ruminococcaceae bacterium]|nr:glycoside hydrolase family 13 protein [Oscillospiraceae bacterium]
MLPRYPLDTSEPLVSLRKYSASGADLTHLGAFPKGETIRLVVNCPRTLGASAVVLRLNRDGEEATDIPFEFTSEEIPSMTDDYELTLDTAALCGGADSGLFYYHLLFVRHADTLFSNSINNVDLELTSHGGNAFRMLVYEPDYTIPSWFGEGVMYHVFVDRFCKGEGETCRRTGKRSPEINPDWEKGIPQYPEYPGAHLTNHVHFGGNLWGVAEKLDYLESLGVKVIYLSPIFEAYSNHKYDTGDYMTVDGGFGGEPALDHLIEKASEKGMRIILDGVFNHTGDDSRYFNRYDLYPTKGAVQAKDSPYSKWYHFRKFPNEYESWWGIPILPKLNHSTEECRRYFTGPDGVCAHYVKKGIGGWRLDVADELCDEFLDELRASVKGASADRKEGEAVIIGEVWENAADKVAYGHRRRYLQGKQLDSVMNYPVRTGILAFLRDGDGNKLYHTLTELYSSYPRGVSDALMNLIGTHDTERILTVLGSEPEDYEHSNDELAVSRLAPERREHATRLLKLASTLQFTVFGIPSVYYGDEVGMEGFHDPFCRFPFPWHDLDDPTRADLLNHYRALGELRRSPAFHGGDFRILSHAEDYIAFERIAPDGSDRVVIAVRRGEGTRQIPLDAEGKMILSCGDASFAKGVLTLGKDSFCVLR